MTLPRPVLGEAEVAKPTLPIETREVKTSNTNFEVTVITSPKAKLAVSPEGH